MDRTRLRLADVTKLNSITIMTTYPLAVRLAALAFCSVLTIKSLHAMSTAPFGIEASTAPYAATQMST